MTIPLVVLAVFSVTAGWVGIPEDFPLFGQFSSNWFHEFVIQTLPVHPEAVSFNLIPLLTSLVVSLGGLGAGWLVYRKVTAGAADPLMTPLGGVYTVLKNKYYFDELYNFVFVRPSYWFAEKFTYLFLDRKVIDGFLHTIARVAFYIGGIFRNYFDKPVVNGFGDAVGEGVKWFGRKFRIVQTGKVQQYMIMALVLAFSTLFYYLYSLLRP